MLRSSAGPRRQAAGRPRERPLPFPAASPALRAAALCAFGGGRASATRSGEPFTCALGLVPLLPLARGGARPGDERGQDRTCRIRLPNACFPRCCSRGEVTGQSRARTVAFARSPPVPGRRAFSCAAIGTLFRDPSLHARPCHPGREGWLGRRRLVPGSGSVEEGRLAPSRGAPRASCRLCPASAGRRSVSAATKPGAPSVSPLPQDAGSGAAQCSAGRPGEGGGAAVAS